MLLKCCTQYTSKGNSAVATGLEKGMADQFLPREPREQYEKAKTYDTER